MANEDSGEDSYEDSGVRLGRPPGIGASKNNGNPGAEDRLKGWMHLAKQRQSRPGYPTDWAQRPTASLKLALQLSSR